MAKNAKVILSMELAQMPVIRVEYNWRHHDKAG
jgi:hypothetical protein